MQFAVLQAELFLFIEAEIKGKGETTLEGNFLPAVLMNNECNSEERKKTTTKRKSSRLRSALTDDGKERSAVIQ
jgi:hypothetical protein